MKTSSLKTLESTRCNNPRPIRIGLFTNNYRPMLGGVATSVEITREALSRRGYLATVVAPAYPDHSQSSRDVIRIPSVPALTHPDFALPVPFWPPTAALIRKLRFDLIHAHHPFLLGQSALRLARQLGCPLVFTYHTHYEKYAHYVPIKRSWVVARAIRRGVAYANRADLVIAPTEETRELLRSRGVHRPIEVLPTGIRLERFEAVSRERARATLGIPQEAKVLLYLGRLDVEKGVGLLLAAFDLIAAAMPGILFLLVGRGTQEWVLRRLAESHVAAGRVRFIGGVPPEETPRYYRAADCFLFASQTETQGLTLAEAMAAGLPVVAARATAVGAIVENGSNGLLVDPTPGALAAGALAILRDDDLRAGLGVQAKRTARAYDVEKVMDRLEGLYQGLPHSAGVL